MKKKSEKGKQSAESGKKGTRPEQQPAVDSARAPELTEATLATTTWQQLTRQSVLPQLQNAPHKREYESSKLYCHTLFLFLPTF